MVGELAKPFILPRVSARCMRARAKSKFFSVINLLGRFCLQRANPMGASEQDHQPTKGTSTMNLTRLKPPLDSPRRWLLWAGLATAVAAAPAFGGTVLRTITYHQITALTNSGALANSALAGDHSLVLSADGRKIVFTRTWYGSTRSNLVYTINFDGSGLTLADAFPSPCDCDADVDISADGSKVIGYDGGLVRMANSDGSNRHQVIQINGGFQEVRVSPDGARVYFSVDRSFVTSPDTGTHEGGLYIVNADGTGFHEAAGVTSFALFFGATPGALIPDGYLYGWNGGTPFAISGDGLKLACFVWTPSPNNRYALVGLNADGTGLHELPLGPQPINSFNKVALSGDGSKVSYYFGYAPCCSSGEELGLINWDGTGRRVLLSTYSTNQSGANLGISLLTMTSDGSKLLCSDTSYLFNTDGSGRLEMGWSARFAANNVLQWGFYRGVMASNGTGFAYLTPAGQNDGGHLQVGTAELNPAGLGLAPAITAASVTPPYIATNGPSPIFALQPTPTNGLLAGGGAQAGILLNGIADQATWQGSSLHDNGANGDAVQGDGIYSDNTAYYSNPPGIGPRTVRFKAELLGADGNYHATAIDLAPFFVVSRTPTNPPPAILSITPSNAPPGGQITINGSGFDPVATNNFILFGNLPGIVISVNPSGTQLVVAVPADLPPGGASVTVSSQGQTSGPASFGGSGTDYLEIFTLAGLDIHGTPGATYRVDYCTNLNAPQWLPLTTNVLPYSPYLWVDLGSLSQPTRFYRAVRLP